MFNCRLVLFDTLTEVIPFPVIVHPGSMLWNGYLNLPSVQEAGRCIR